jgi:serine/threonine protein kinase
MKLVTMKFVLAIIICIISRLLIVLGDSKASSTFTPHDNFLINCGSTIAPNTTDGRVFKTDAQSNYLLSAKDVIRVSLPSSTDTPPLYLSARIFRDQATYKFPLSTPGWHWIRLHFFPLNNTEFNLTAASFTVTTDSYVLLHSFSVDNSSAVALKEFLVNATTNQLSLHFLPLRDSAAFINAIEVVSAPDILISDVASTLVPVGQINGLSLSAYQTVYRLNVGGPILTSANDTLGRRWDKDDSFIESKAAAVKTAVAPSTINYPDGTSSLIAPNWVYATAVKMADSQVGSPNFNITWQLDVESSFGYLVRLHFADIISKSLNDLYFNVYINEKMAISGLDLSTITSDLSAAYYKDFVLNSSSVTDQITVQIGPLNEDTGTPGALLNGLEVLKMNNSVGSLDGEFGVDGKKASSGIKGRVVAAAGIGFACVAFVGVGAMMYNLQKKKPEWERRSSFSSWLLPIHSGHSTFMNNSKGSGFGSHKSGYTFSSTSLGRCFSFAEIQTATKNFDQNAIIGVGGFGNVYLGELDDGTKVAVKRGNPQSDQGINEFQTEIQILSKLRHRHLVSLIGYCDENSEMILVYEYMANGVFRDHIYGKDLPSPLSWKQRLEVCIGAARGLHYLHTGTAQGIIHRDVKTTNILLDDNFVAKVSDFGLSKDAPGMNQTHVSTAVKGSFGYLDPEYFRCQQLTDKSDVYSFGVVLLEALCARPPINPALPREQVSLAEWALQSKRKGLLEKIIDPVLVGTINKDSLNKFAESAEKCLSEIGTNRPSMGDVLWNLEYSLQLQEANPPTGEEATQSNSLATAAIQANTPVTAPTTQQTATDAIPIDIGDDDEATSVETKVANESPLIDLNSTTSSGNSCSGIGNDLFVNPSRLNGR